jgi:hypothetical protein
MKREKRVTKKERKALAGGPRPAGEPNGGHQHHHIHCTACGKHLDEADFEGTPAKADWVACQHGSTFASCAACVTKTKEILAEHDRTGKPVQAVAAWH